MTESRSHPALLQIRLGDIASRRIAEAVRDVVRVPGFSTDPGRTVDEYVARRMPFLTSNEQTITSAAILDGVIHASDSLDTISEEVMLRLQSAADQKSQIEAMISNVMQAAADTESAIIKNMPD